MLPITRPVVRLSSLAARPVKAEGLTYPDGHRTVTYSLQSDVLGHLPGIRNILCLSGDHQSFGNQPQAKGVFDIEIPLTDRAK